MKLRTFLASVVMFVVQANAFAGAGAEAPPTPVMVISYWGYVALPLALIVAFVVNGWLIPRKE